VDQDISGFEEEQLIDDVDIEEILIDPQFYEEDVVGGETINDFLTLAIDETGDAQTLQGEPLDISETLSKLVEIGTGDSSLLRTHQIVGQATVMADKCPRPTIADDMHESIVSGSRSDAEVDALLLRLFRLSHPLNKFPIHMMPDIDTCPYCGILGSDIPKSQNLMFYQHIRDCAKDAALRSLPSAFKGPNQELLTTPCQFNVGHKTTDQPNGRPCNKTFTGDIDGWRKHMIGDHLSRPNRECRFGAAEKACSFLASNKTLYAEKMTHLIEDHDINVFKEDQIIQWCSYCETWELFVPRSAAEEEHYLPHLSAALQNVVDIGYSGVEVSYRWLIPATCIFCLHDANLRAKERVHVSERLGDNEFHIWHHINKIDTGHSKKAPCPASVLADAASPTCLCQDLFTAEAMREHLDLVHGIRLLDSKDTNIRKERKKRARITKIEAIKPEQTVEGEDVVQAETPAVPDGILGERCPNIPTKKRRGGPKASNA
jgi:hypothetical protein